MNTTKERKWLLERDLWWKPLKWVKPLFGPVDCTLCFLKFIHSNTSPYTAYRPQICISVFDTRLDHLKISLNEFDLVFFFLTLLTSQIPSHLVYRSFVSQSVTVHLFTLRKRFNLQMYREVYCSSTIFLNQLFKLSTSQYIFTNDSTQSGGGKRGGGHERSWH